MTHFFSTFGKNVFSTIFSAVFFSLLRIRAVLMKEMVTLLKDPGVRRILIVPVVAQSVLFGYGATFNLERVPTVILDLSGSAASARVVRAVTENGIFTPAPVPQGLHPERSLADWTRAVDEGYALVGILIPETFDECEANGTGGEIFVAVDARNTTTANVATGYVNAVVANLNAEENRLGAVTMRERYRYNENNVTRFNIMPGLIVALSMLQVMLLAGLAISREREEGSFDMMLMTPAHPWEIFVGKAVPPILIALFQSFLIFAVCRWWFEIPFAGDYLVMGGVLALFSLSIVGIALALSAMSSTIQTSVILAFFMVLPALVLSGLMTPIGAMPEWMQTVTLFNPTRYGMAAVRMVYFEGADWRGVWPLMQPLIVTSLITMPAAMWLFRNKTT